MVFKINNFIFNVICFSLLLTIYFSLLSRFQQLLSFYLWLLSSYYWLLLVISRYSGLFPLDQKKGNLVPEKVISNVTKMQCQQIIAQFHFHWFAAKFLKSYGIVHFFDENSLISPKQSSFKPGDSCINHFISITHETYKSLDAGLKVRSIFLDISKPFDKMWFDKVWL